MCIMSIYTYTHLHKKRNICFYLFCSANIPRLKPLAFPPFIIVRIKHIKCVKVQRTKGVKKCQELV